MDGAAWSGLPAADLARTWVLVMGGLLAKGGILLLLVGGLAGLLRGAAAATRHLLWTLGVGGLLLLPLLTGVLPAWRIEAPQQIPLPVGALRFVPPSELGAAGPLAGQPERSPGRPAEATTAGEAGTGTGGAIVAGGASRPVAADAGSAGAGPDGAAGARPAAVSVAQLLFWVWLAGVVTILGGFLAGSLKLRRVVGAARPLAAGEGADLAREILAALGIRRPVTLLVADDPLSPQTWGLLRPTVLLPRQWRDWSEDRRRQVLVHELAHIRRGDCLTQTAAHLACAVYWCNPLVWFAARRMRVERERACDDHVLASGAPASSYADNLLEIAATIGRLGRPAFGEVAMARSSQMSGRLLAVLDPARRRNVPGRGVIVVACLVLAVVATPLAALQTRDGPAAGPDDRDGGDTPRITLAEFERAWGKLGERMIEAAQDHDADRLASCYTRDAVLLAPGMRTLYGREDVQEQAHTFWTVPIDDIEIADTEFYRIGDMFCVVGKVKAFDRRGQLLGTNRFMSLYRYENGRWRIHRDIVNN